MSVAVVIVTFNAIQDIDACIQALGTGHRIVVVDNASTDGTVDALDRLHSSGRIQAFVRNEINAGFARAVNRGLVEAGPGDVLLLNPDARITGEAIEALREIAARPDIGIVSPLVDNGPGVYALGAGEQPALWPMFTHFSGLARLFPRVRRLRGRYLYRASLDQDLVDTGWVSGGCLYWSERARAAVGSLSERWFMYGEDVDLARRVLAAGFRVVVARDIHAFHALGGSVNESTGPVSTMWATNTADYYRVTFRPGPLRFFLWRAVQRGVAAAQCADQCPRSEGARCRGTAASPPVPGFRACCVVSSYGAVSVNGRSTYVRRPSLPYSVSRNTYSPGGATLPSRRLPFHVAARRPAS